MADNLHFLKEYIELLKKHGKTSEETIEIYRREIEDFIGFISQNKIENLKEDIGIKYIENLKKKFSPLSIKRKIASVNGFFKYLVKKSIIDQNPFSEIKIIQEKKDNSPKITQGEIARVMDYCKDDEKGKRDRIVIYLLFISGLKINQILKIKKTNILNSNEINILGRNGIETIKLNSEGINILKDYLEEREKKTEEDLFGDLSRQNFRARFMKYCKEAGISTPISPIEIKKSVAEKKNENITKNDFFQEMKREYMRIGIGDE
ncbi:MAG: tyrosine-type recombinase/integrase [Fusobacteriaceae bacterium]